MFDKETAASTIKGPREIDPTSSQSSEPSAAPDLKQIKIILNYDIGFLFG